jgi:thioredoxin 1
MSSLVLNLSADNFQQHTSSQSGVVLLDFWADWCQPCKQLSPILEDIAELYANELQVCKLNADQEKAITEQFRVRGLPTLIVLVNGVEQQRMVGLSSKTRISQLLEQYL